MFWVQQIGAHKRMRIPGYHPLRKTAAGPTTAIVFHAYDSVRLLVQAHGLPQIVASAPIGPDRLLDATRQISFHPGLDKNAESVMGDVTNLLRAWVKGDRAAFDQLMPIIYDELHRRAAFHMRNERPDHTWVRPS